MFEGCRCQLFTWPIGINSSTACEIMKTIKRRLWDADVETDTHQIRIGYTLDSLRYNIISDFERNKKHLGFP